MSLVQKHFIYFLALTKMLSMGAFWYGLFDGWIIRFANSQQSCAKTNYKTLDAHKKIINKLLWLRLFDNNSMCSMKNQKQTF